MSLSLSGATPLPAAAVDFGAGAATKSTAGSSHASWASIFPAVEEQERPAPDSESAGLPPSPHISLDGQAVQTGKTTQFHLLSLFSASTAQVGRDESSEVAAESSTDKAGEAAATSPVFYRSMVTVEVAMTVVETVVADAPGLEPAATGNPAAGVAELQKAAESQTPQRQTSAADRGELPVEVIVPVPGAKLPTPDTVDPDLAATEPAKEQVSGRAPSSNAEIAPGGAQNFPRPLKQRTLSVSEQDEYGANKSAAALNVYTLAASNSTPDQAAPSPANGETTPSTPTLDTAGAQRNNGAIVERTVLTEPPAAIANSKAEIAFEGLIESKSVECAADAKPPSPEAATRAAVNAGVPHLVRHAANLDRGESAQLEPSGALESSEGNVGARPARIKTPAEDSKPFHDFNGGSGGFEQSAPEIESPLTQASSAPYAARSSMEGTAAAKPSTLPAAAHLDAADAAQAHEATPEARTVALKIQSEGRGTANVILTDRAGQIHVTVRAADPTLAQSLRSDLGSLAGGLEQQGFGVKLWYPSSSGSSADGDSGTNSSEYSQQSGGGHNRSRHNSDEAGHRNSRQQEWTEDID